MKMIRKLRKQLHLSQTELARRLNVHQTAVSQWENDRTQPDVETVKRIADFFSVPTDFLFDDREGASGSARTDGRIPVYAELRPDGPTDLPVAWATASEPDDRLVGVIAAERNMETRICRGDVMIVRRQNDVENDDLALVSVEGRRAVCYRVFKGDCLCLTSYHADFAPLLYSWKRTEDGTVRILGRVMESRASF